MSAESSWHSANSSHLKAAVQVTATAANESSGSGGSDDSFWAKGLSI